MKRFVPDKAIDGYRGQPREQVVGAVRRGGEQMSTASGFTAKYNAHMLVYYEEHELYIEAARREKRFKNWPRQWKINLIEKHNPEWHDLYHEICQ